MKEKVSSGSALSLSAPDVPSDLETYGASPILQDSTEELPLSLFI